MRKNRNFGKAKHINHVSKVSPGTLAAMQKLFGINLNEFIKAVYGDHKSIQKLADMGRLSEVAQTNLEPALKAAKLSIETTRDINKAIAELVKQSATSGKQVTGAIFDSQIAEKKFKNQLTEARAKYINDVSAETARHLHNSHLIKMRGVTSDLTALVRYQTEVRKEQNKLPLANQQAAVDFDKTVAQQLWARGSEADLSKIPKPNYRKQNPRGITIFGRFKKWMGI
ncbi:MAG: hypothetical protein F6J89_15950 [Symploca sp. SIO1C4]|uniref:Uncharacterized protein n=1 Tax=Symploca sp. SIO1C4 TaxID=2607765 RepID=A0A6B3NBW8_9CYAN|nr:hypothetical protein [Symploca sp. SIO1C4]